MRASRVFCRLALAVTLVSLSIALVGLDSTPVEPVLAGRADSPRHPAQIWLGWTSLGKPAGVGDVSYPVVGQQQDGRLEVFVHGSGQGATGYNVYRIGQAAPNGTWGTWTPMGPPPDALAAPSVIQNQDGRLEVFAQKLWIGFGGPNPGPHYEVQHIYQTTANGGWASWSNLAQPSSGGLVDLWEPYVGRNLDGRLAVLVKGQDSDGFVWLKSQTGAGVDTWTSWTSLGKPSVHISPVLSVGQNQDGRLEVFTFGSNNEIYHIWQKVPNDDWSASGWGSFGKPLGVNVYTPAVGRNQDGRQEFFAAGDDGNIWHKWQVAANSFWSGWGNLGKPPGVNLGDPIVGQYQDGALSVLARGSDSAIWNIGQTAPNGGWSSWLGLGKPSVVNLTDQIAVGRNQNGLLMLFAVGSDGALWMNQQGLVIIPCVGLTWNVNPSSGGSVNVAPAPDCGISYLVGTAVTLTAVPSSGYGFSHWSGDASGSGNPTAIAMDRDKSVAANFVSVPVPHLSRVHLPMVVR